MEELWPYALGVLPAELRGELVERVGLTEVDGRRARLRTLTSSRRLGMTISAALRAGRSAMVTDRRSPFRSYSTGLAGCRRLRRPRSFYPQTHIYDRERYAQVRQVAAEMFAADGEVAPVDELLALETGQATPKLSVRGVVFRGDTILLVRDWSSPPAAGSTSVETEAAVREVLEESGYETRAVRLLALLDRDRHDYEPHAWRIWKAIVLCELLGDDQRPFVSETDAARFFTRGALPEPLPSGDATRALVERAFEHLEHPEWPADLD